MCKSFCSFLGQLIHNQVGTQFLWSDNIEEERCHKKCRNCDLRTDSIRFDSLQNTDSSSERGIIRSISAKMVR